MTKLQEPRWVALHHLEGERFLAELDADEVVLAYGKQRDSWDYLLVTPRRIITKELNRFVSLPFDMIVWAEQMIEETHRYRLTLHHRPIDRPRDKALPWDLPRHWRRFRARHRWNRESVLRFSRQNTVAAEAIRRELNRRGSPLGPLVVKPHVHDDRSVAYIYHPGALRGLRSRTPPVD